MRRWGVLSSVGGPRLDPAKAAELQRLQETDRKVRNHERAHQAAAGGTGGGVSFQYAIGPDGRPYAVGGEVPIHVETGRTPDETIANARRVRQAALAPADPSAQDLAVAAMASQVEAQAEAQKVAAAQELGRTKHAGVAANERVLAAGSV